MEPWFVLWTSFLLSLLCISINLWYSHAWKSIFMSSKVLLVGTWLCWWSYKKGFAGLLFLRFAAFLVPLAHHWNVNSISLFNSYYFGRCWSELAELVTIPYSQGTSTGYFDRFHDFFVTIPRCYKDIYVNSFFPARAILWNSLPIKSFPLSYDPNGFNSKINRNLLAVGSFWTDVLYALIFLCFFFR